MNKKKKITISIVAILIVCVISGIVVFAISNNKAEDQVSTVKKEEIIEIGQVQNVTAAQVDNTTIDVTWDTLTDEAITVDTYVVEWRTAGNITGEVITDTTRASITECTVGTEYTITVKAKYEDAYGEKSDAFLIVTRDLEAQSSTNSSSNES